MVRLFIKEDTTCSLLHAALYGGAKSKARSSIAPYQTGTVWLYSNPIKNTHSITDFAITSYRFSIRESLVRLWSAALCAELIDATKGNISWVLVNAFLDGIENLPDNECKVALIRFLWRVLLGEGIAPEIDCCAACRKSFTDLLANEYFYYHTHEELCLCSSCSDISQSGFQLSKEALFFLLAVKEKPPAYSRALPLSQQTYGMLRRFLFYLITKMNGKKLNTIESAQGLL